MRGYGLSFAALDLGFGIYGLELKVSGVVEGSGLGVGDWDREGSWVITHTMTSVGFRVRGFRIWGLGLGFRAYRV